MNNLKTFIVEKILPHRIHFTKYFLIGISSFVIDMSLLYFLKEFVGLTQTAAVLIVQAVTMSYVFILNKYWSFSNSAWQHSQIIKFFSLYLFNYAFSAFFMYSLSQVMGYHFMLIRFFTIALMVCWNYLLYKYWIYV